MTKEDLGETVRRLREERGLSQTQLARKLGWEQARVLGVEKGKWNINIKSLDDLGRELGLEMSLVIRKGYH